MTKQYVILNEVKNLKVCETVKSSTNLEILRFTQDDKQYVILNEVKNPLKADKRQRTKRIASEEILRVAQDDKTVCHSERSEESPQSRQATTHIAYCQRGDPSRCSG